MNNLQMGYTLVSAIALMPALAAYFSAKYYFSFKARSWRQIIAISLALLAMFGAIFLQDFVVAEFGVQGMVPYLRKLTLFQYLAAVIVFYWKLSRVYGALKRGREDKTRH